MSRAAIASLVDRSASATHSQTANSSGVRPFHRREVRLRRLVHVGPVVEQPCRHPAGGRICAARCSIVTPSGGSRRPAWAPIEHGDHRLLAASHHGVAETTDAVAWASTPRAPRFSSCAVISVTIRRTRVPGRSCAGLVASRLGQTAVARVRSRVEQQPRHLDVTRHDRDVDGTYRSQTVPRASNRRFPAFARAAHGPRRGRPSARPRATASSSRPRWRPSASASSRTGTSAPARTARRAGRRCQASRCDGRTTSTTASGDCARYASSSSLACRRSLIDVANSRASRAWAGASGNGHDSLSPSPGRCRRHSPGAPGRPLSRQAKRDHPDDDKTDVGVDASPFRGQVTPRCASASIPRRSRRLSALAPHACENNTSPISREVARRSVGQPERIMADPDATAMNCLLSNE